MSDKGVQDCSAGTVLFREGDQGDCMYVVKSGRVELSKRIHDSEIVIEELGDGEFCGELAMLGQSRRPVTAVVTKDASVIQVENDQFEDMVRGNTDIALRMLKKLTQRLTRAQYRVSNLTLRSNTARVVHQLKAEAEQRNGDLGAATPIPDNLADVLALEIGEVKRVLGELVRDEFISIDQQGNFQILDPAAYDRYLQYLELRDRFEQ